MNWLESRGWWGGESGGREARLRPLQPPKTLPNVILEVVLEVLEVVLVTETAL